MTIEHVVYFKLEILKDIECVRKNGNFCCLINSMDCCSTVSKTVL